MNGRPSDEKSTHPGGEHTSRGDATFYVVTDERFFVGVVGLVNSLRLVGHRQRIVVLDCGLTEHQRNVLACECELVLPPDAWAKNPQLLKPFANMLRPTGTVVVLDSDSIVARSLDPVLRAAADGRVCVCADPDSERWFADWERIFELPNSPRRQTYISSGLVAFSVDRWPDLLPRWWDSCQRIRSYPTAFYDVSDSPTAQADQDALNAILMGELPREALDIQPQEMQPSMEQLRWHTRMLDVGALSCSLLGHPVTIVHPAVKTKPFECQWWTGQGRSVYPLLLRRSLVGQDTCLRVVHDVPIWLRPGRLGETVTRVLCSLNRLGRVRWWLRKWQVFRLARALLRRRRRV